MSSGYQNILIIGTGNLASALIAAFQQHRSEFTIGVLTRNPSSEMVTTLQASGIKILSTDYSDRASVAKVFTGFDVVISTINDQGLFLQPMLVAAAIDAKVKRFIPSDFVNDPFGSLHPNLKYQDFYVNVTLPRRQIRYLLEELGREGKIEYTCIDIGGFMDMLFTIPFYVQIDYPKRKIEYALPGNAVVTWNSFSTISNYVVAALLNPEKSRNRVLRFGSDTASYEQIVEKFKVISGDSSWVGVGLDHDELFERFGGDDFAVAILEVFASGAARLDGPGRESFDNKLFPEVKASTIDEMIKEYLEKVKST